MTKTLLLRQTTGLKSLIAIIIFLVFDHHLFSQLPQQHYTAEQTHAIKLGTAQPDIFNVTAIISHDEVFVPYTIYSSSGQPVLNGTIAKYDDRYKGELSLKAYQTGTYYIVFNLAENILVKRILKVE